MNPTTDRLTLSQTGLVLVAGVRQNHFANFSDPRVRVLDNEADMLVRPSRHLAIDPRTEVVLFGHFLEHGTYRAVIDKARKANKNVQIHPHVLGSGVIRFLVSSLLDTETDLSLDSDSGEDAIDGFVMLIGEEGKIESPDPGGEFRRLYRKAKARGFSISLEDAQKAFFSERMLHYLLLGEGSSPELGIFLSPGLAAALEASAVELENFGDACSDLTAFAKKALAEIRLAQENATTAEELLNEQLAANARLKEEIVELRKERDTLKEHLGRVIFALNAVRSTVDEVLPS